MRKPWYKMKKVWAAIIPAIVIITTEYSDMDLSTEDITAIVLPVIAFILGESWTDGKHNSGKNIL